MGKFEKLGLFVKKRFAEFEQKSKEEKAFRQVLNKKLIVAKRQAFAKEAEKQARLQAKARAKLKFSPSKSPTTSAQQGLDFAVNFGVQQKKQKGKKEFDPFNI